MKTQPTRFARLARCALACALVFTPPIASAQDPESCGEPRFADVGWTDITATTALVSVALESLGYAPHTTVLGVPVTYASLANGDIDIFLGNWMPTMEADLSPYRDDGSVVVLPAANLDGAQYTLAAPRYAHAAGLTSFADIAKFHDKLDGKIYGIEPGNDGNRLLIEMIESDEFGLGEFELVESSEAGMLTQAERAMRRGEWIVFLGWTPHPVMAEMEIEFLEGSDPGRQLRRRASFHQPAPRLRRRMPECRALARQSQIRSENGKRGDGADSRRRRSRKKRRANGLCKIPPHSRAGFAASKPSMAKTD